MNPKTVIPILVLILASSIQAQENAPAPEQQHADMMKRGDMGMGFLQETTTHHFFLVKDGGVIQVSANNPKDHESRDHIRMHLSHVAMMFSEGNFNIPMFVHDKVPARGADNEKAPQRDSLSVSADGSRWQDRD